MEKISVTHKIYTPMELAKLLQVSVKTLARWRYKRIGPLYSKEGRIIRYRADHVNAFLDQKTHLLSNKKS